jgi:Dolichyl-phosphate-mannose-protein mannosyltransferase
MEPSTPVTPGSALPRAFLRLSTRSALVALVGLGFALRLYLSLTSYCMSGDGVSYLGMAQAFAAGDTRRALMSVFSPLYPVLIALAHPLLPNWEIAGNLISAILGSAAILTVFGMTQAMLERRDLALGAAALMAFHPDMAAYGGSVRTEAGFIFLMTTAVWVLLSGMKSERLIDFAGAGLIGGIAYLYRTEAIGLLVFGAAFIPLRAFLWKRWNFWWGLAASALFSLVFLTVAAPYLLFLHSITGRWSVGREFTAAMILGMGNLTPKTAAWRSSGFSASASPLAPVFANPGLYFYKSAINFFASCYGFIQALGLVLTAFMLIGLRRRRRNLYGNFAEAFAGLFVLFYVTGFSLSYTGTRFMSHLIPYSFGWVIVGIEEASFQIEWLTDRWRWPRIPQGVLALAVWIGLLPQAVWPIGYDQRGLRYAGERIHDDSPAGSVVASFDGRVAYYAGARFVMLPSLRVPDLCEWLGESHANYLLVTDRYESPLRLRSEAGCFKLLQRYPGHRDSYYDLFAITPAH